MSTVGRTAPVRAASRWTATAKQHLKNDFFPPLLKLANDVKTISPVFLPYTCGRKLGEATRSSHPPRSRGAGDGRQCNPGTVFRAARCWIDRRPLPGPSLTLSESLPRDLLIEQLRVANHSLCWPASPFGGGRLRVGLNVPFPFEFESRSKISGIINCGGVQEVLIKDGLLSGKLPAETMEPFGFFCLEFNAVCQFFCSCLGVFLNGSFIERTCRKLFLLLSADGTQTHVALWQLAVTLCGTVQIRRRSGRRVPIARALPGGE